MEDRNTFTSSTAIHNTPRPSSHTVAADEISLQSISQNHVSDSIHGQNVILHLLYDSGKTPDPENPIKTEETLPLIATAITGDETGNNRLHVPPSAPLMEIKPIPEGPPPPYNPYYMPRRKNVTTPKTTSQKRTKIDQSPRKRGISNRDATASLDTRPVRSTTSRIYLWPYWLLLTMILVIAFVLIFAYKIPSVGLSAADKTPIDEDRRQIVLEEWKNGRVFSSGNEEDMRDVAILLGNPNYVSSKEIIDWIRQQDLTRH